MKNPLSMIFEPVKNKLVDDVKRIGLEQLEKAKQWIRDRDEDGDGHKDTEQIHDDVMLIVDCAKTQFQIISSGFAGVMTLAKKQAEAGTRLAALFACYYVKYGPKEKAELVAALPKRDDQANIA